MSTYSNQFQPSNRSMVAGNLNPQNQQMIDMFYAKIDKQKNEMGIANRNAVLRGAQTERKVDKSMDPDHLKKKKTPSSYKSNNSHHSLKSPF